MNSLPNVCNIPSNFFGICPILNTCYFFEFGTSQFDLFFMIGLISIWSLFIRAKEILIIVKKRRNACTIDEWLKIFIKTLSF
jgi:hypothetical protein